MIFYSRLSDDFRGSTLSLPPPYAEVVNESLGPGAEDGWVPQPPPEVQDLGLMADTREKLTSEIDALYAQTSSNQEHLYNLIDRIQVSKDAIHRRKGKITNDFIEWKKLVLRMVEAHCDEEYEKFTTICSKETERLTKNITAVKEIMNTAQRLQKTSTILKKTGNAHDLQNLKDSLQTLNKKVTRMDASGMTFTTAEAWQLQQPCVDDRFKQNTLLALGYIYTPPLPQGAVSATLTTTSMPETAAAEPEAAAPEAAEATSNDETDDSDDYLLMYSFNTKTYKDKARSHPMSFVVTPDQRVIVPDRYNKKIKCFTLRGQLIREIQHPVFRGPQCVCLTPDGNIAISDSEIGKVYIFSDKGDLISEYQNLVRPVGIAFNHQGQLMAADMQRSAVDVFQRTGNTTPSLSVRYYQATVHNDTTGRDEQRMMNFFMRPQYVAVDSSGQRFVVSDRAAHCIQIHDHHGRFLARIGGPGCLNGQFNAPYGVTYSNTGDILVADYENNRIQAVHPLSGEARVLIGHEIGLKFPTCIQQLPDGKILVAEYLSGCIKVFGTSHHVDGTEVEDLPPCYTDVFGQPRAQHTSSDASQPSAPSVPYRRPAATPWDVESII